MSASVASREPLDISRSCRWSTPLPRGRDGRRAVALPAGKDDVTCLILGLPPLVLATGAFGAGALRPDAGASSCEVLDFHRLAARVCAKA